MWDDILSWWQLAEGAELTARQKQVQNFFGMMAVLLGPILLFFVSQIIAPGSIPLLLHVIWGVMASGSIALSSNKKVILSKEFLLNFSPIVGAIKLKGNKEIAIVNPF